MILENESRIEHISQMIFQIASGNFDAQIDRTDKEDELDAIVTGINMLREELKATTVSRDYMDSIYKGVVDMLFVLDENFKIQSVNSAATDVLGFDEHSIIGRPFPSLINSSSEYVFQRFVDGELKNHKSLKNVELYINDKQGNPIPTSCSFSWLYDSFKQTNGILLIAKDTILQKKAEIELRKAKEFAEAANISKSRFLANMSHEIRTPLNGILGIAEILLSDQSNPNREYLEIIRASGQSLARLINDILDLSKIESGKLTLEKTTFDFSSTVISNLQTYKFLAEQKGLTFNYFVDGTVPKFVIGDPTRINQIIVNLVGNAIKFTEQGKIDVRFSAQEKPSGEVILKGEVKDTGVGIPAEKSKVIFESFTQADDSINRKFGGTGLGLTIVENLVKQMEGTVSVKSSVEPSSSGSTFTFVIKLQLPPSAARSKTPAAGAEKPSFKRPVHILIVDDNEINLLVAKKAIMNFGGKVTVAGGGREAIELVQTNDFDLILMDIQMPDMDGYATTRQLRQMNFQKPIVALSANAYNEHIQQSLDSGMNDHVQKPFNPQHLFKVVNQHLESALNKHAA
jgi:two-component system, sensor histidine kinase